MTHSTDAILNTVGENRLVTSYQLSLLKNSPVITPGCFLHHGGSSLHFFVLSSFMQVERVFSFQDDCKGSGILVRIPEVY